MNTYRNVCVLFLLKKGGSKITVEELDIIVQAHVENAVKELKKLLPEVRKQSEGIQREFNKINIKDIKVNVNITKVTNEIRNIKRQIQDVFAPDTSKFAVNTKREITGISKKFNKLSGKKIDLENAVQKSQKKDVKVEEKASQADSVSKNTSAFSKMIPKLKGISGMTVGIKNQIKKWGTGLKNGLGHILKYACTLIPLKDIYSVLTSSASSWLSSQNAEAKQLSANIEYMKIAMGSVFAPVIQYVTSLIYQLMRAIQSVVYAFSGINIFAKATASSMKGTAGSAKQASKSLSSVHSEISNVSENNSEGDGGTNPNIDLSQMDNMPNSITEAIKNGDWYGIGNIIGQKINEGLSSIPWDTIRSEERRVGKECM